MMPKWKLGVNSHRTKKIAQRSRLHTKYPKYHTNALNTAGYTFLQKKPTVKGVKIN